MFQPNQGIIGNLSDQSSNTQNKPMSDRTNNPLETHPPVSPTPSVDSAMNETIKKEIRDKVQFILGMGYDSITGQNRGNSMFDSAHNLCSISDTSEIHYHADTFETYDELHKILDINTTLTFDVANISSADIGNKVFRTVQLNEYDTFIVLEIRSISHTSMVTDKAILRDQLGYINTLKKDENAFLIAHGDRYIKELKHGKKLIAIIQFNSKQHSSAQEIKNNINAKLKNIHSQNVATSNSVDIKNDEFNAHKITKITIECAGAGLNPPQVGDLQGLFEFISAFNKAPTDGTIVEQKAEAYATDISFSNEIAFANFEKKVAQIKAFLTQVNSLAAKIRIMGNNLKKLKDLFGDNQVEDKKLDTIMHDLDDFKVNLHNIINKIINDTVNYDKASLEADFSALHSKFEKIAIPKARLLTTIVCKEGHIGPFIHTHQGDKIRINYSSKVNYLFWQVDKTSHPHAEDILFSVDVKNSKDPKGHRSYKTIFRDVSGKGSFLQAKDAFESGQDKIQIKHHPKHTGDKSFKINVIEVQDIEPISPIKKL